MALAMASMAGLRGSSPAVLEGSRLQSNRLISRGNTGRTAVGRTGFSVRASSAETETSRRAMLGLVATGIVSGSFVQAVLAVGPASALGEYTPIKDLQSPEVINIAEFAVDEINKKAGSETSLVLEKVLKGESQVVAGTNYRLVISTKDRGATYNYETVVFKGLPPKSSLELTSFTPLLL